MGPAKASPAIVRFGIFEANFRAGELRRDGAKVRLQDLPFRMLVLLLSRPNEVVTHDELRDALWPSDVYVDFERGIRSAVKRLRDALGDPADNPIFIQTVERRGYRWIGSIQPVDYTPGVETISPKKSERASSSAWRKLVFVLPVVALVFAWWIFRPAYRSAKAGSKAGATSGASNIRNAANPEAEDFYLKGRFYWNKRTPESLNQAVDAFTQAIIHDPNYAPAYMGLADSYNLLREYAAMPAREAYSRAYAAAKRAVELDGKSSEAHASLAFVTFYSLWDAIGAEREYRRAIELDPNNAKAHHWYATFLQTISRHDESLVEIARARELDPHSSSILADRGRLLWAAGHREEALQLLKQMEAGEPEFVSPHRYLRYAYFEMRDYPNYLAELKKEALQTHSTVTLAVAEAASRGYVGGGERGLLDQQLREQKRLYDQGTLASYWVAQTENRLGKTQDALRHLEICAESHDDMFLLLREDTTFNNLRNNPVFQQLLARQSLPAAE